MARYIVEIEPQYSLTEVENQIQGEEAGASLFVESHVAVYRGVQTNLVTFSEIDPPALPKPSHVIIGAPGVGQPANTDYVWTGTMLISGKSELVSVYRDK